MDYETALAIGGKELYAQGRHYVYFELPDGTCLDLDFGPDGNDKQDLTVEEIEARMRGD